MSYGKIILFCRNLSKYLEVRVCQTLPYASFPTPRTLWRKGSRQKLPSEAYRERCGTDPTCHPWNTYFAAKQFKMHFKWVNQGRKMRLKHLTCKKVWQEKRNYLAFNRSRWLWKSQWIRRVSEITHRFRTRDVWRFDARTDVHHVLQTKILVLQFDVLRLQKPDVIDCFAKNGRLVKLKGNNVKL